MNLNIFPPELQYRFLIDLDPNTLFQLCIKGSAPITCSDDNFWRQKYRKDFEDFRINLAAQDYRTRYLQIAKLMRPSDWFGYYPDDKNNLRSIIGKFPTLPLLPQPYVGGGEKLRISYYSTMIREEYNEETISRVIQGEELDLFGFSWNLVQYLMTKKGQEFVINVIKHLGLDRLVTSIDNVYNFLHYLIFGFNLETLSRIKINDILDRQELSTLSSLTQPQLREVYGDKIKDNNIDHASLLILAISGLFTKPPPPDIPIDQNRLGRIAALEPIKVWNLVYYYAKRLKKENEVNQNPVYPMWIQYTDGYPPYMFVTLQTPNIVLEDLLTKINEKNYHRTMEKLIRKPTIKGYAADLTSIMDVFLDDPNPQPVKWYY